MLTIARGTFLFVGLCFSIFYGWNAVDIFVDSNDEFVKAKALLDAWKWHQRWLNFMGSMVGWIAAWYFLFDRFIPYRHSFTFKGSDAAVILVALLGMGGFLPLTLSLVPTALGSIVSLVKKD